MSLSLLAILLGIVEGATEFLPISSTGHLVLVGSLLDFESRMASPDQAEVFMIVIQLGAILAVGFYFRKKLFDSLFAKSVTSISGRLRTHLLVAFLPAAIAGLLLHKFIKVLLASPIIVAIVLILGGVAIILIERKSKPTNRVTDLRDMTTEDALVIGLAQMLSLIPGVSRAAATIMGGMLKGLKRSAATEFSFLLSFPVMIAASGYELLKYHDALTSDMLAILSIGFVVAFISALGVVAWLIRYVQRHSFAVFGWYRIGFGLLFLIAFWLHAL